jgi:hypothetical protein
MLARRSPSCLSRPDTGSIPQPEARRLRHRPIRPRHPPGRPESRRRSVAPRRHSEGAQRPENLAIGRVPDRFSGGGLIPQGAPALQRCATDHAGARFPSRTHPGRIPDLRCMWEARSVRPLCRSFPGGRGSRRANVAADGPSAVSRSAGCPIASAVADGLCRCRVQRAPSRQRRGTDPNASGHRHPSGCGVVAPSRRHSERAPSAVILRERGDRRISSLGSRSIRAATVRERYRTPPLPPPAPYVMVPVG